jgi:hypothetical protein
VWYGDGADWQIFAEMKVGVVLLFVLSERLNDSKGERFVGRSHDHVEIDGRLDMGWGRGLGWIGLSEQSSDRRI